MCLKIDLPGSDRSATADEVAYLSKLRRLRPEYDGSVHAQFRGWRMTNLGAAAAFDLVRSADGTIAPSLFDLIWDDFSNDTPQAGSAIDWQRIYSAIGNFRRTLLRHAIPVRDLNPKNVCVRTLASGDYEIVAVDCIGHRDFIPAIDVIPWLARKQIRRRFEKFANHRHWRHLQSDYHAFVAGEAA